MAARSKQIDFVDPEQYPLEASAQGNNAYYCDQCAHVSHRPAYAACLNRIELRRAGRLDTVWSDCSVAIGRKDCLALDMREQEKKAGHALFYINRSLLLANARANAGFTGSRYVSSSSKAPDVSTGHVIADSPDYAAAINKAISKQKRASTENTQNKSSQPITPAVESNSLKSFTGDLPKGLSLAEIAKQAKIKTIDKAGS